MIKRVVSGKSLILLANILSLCALSLVASWAQNSKAPLPPNCSEESPDGGCALYDVSIIELIANPTKYDGLRVRLMGYIHFEFEGNGIYLHQEDRQYRLGYNGLWVEWAARARSSANCQDAYVLIEGIFRAGNRGHMGLRSGAVTDITRCILRP